MVVLYFALAAIAVLVVGIGLTRSRAPRKAGIEGIEDARAAQAYDWISTWPQFRLIRRMFARRLSRYRPGGTVVDIGCGPGRLVALMARRFPGCSVVGIDASPEMIEAARNRTAATNGKVEYRVGDVESLPFENGTVDFAVSTLSLHHWSSPKRGLAEIARVLKPGGQLLLFDFRRDARRFLYWLIRFAQTFVVPSPLRAIREPTGSLLSSYSVAELRALLATTELREARVTGGAAWLYLWARRD